MKKVLFSVCALAALLTGCAKSDVVDAPNFETPITFEAYSGKVPVSKATSIDNAADLAAEDGFMVYAYETTATTVDETTTYTPDYTKPYALMNGVSVTGTIGTDEDGNEKITWSYGNSPIYWPNNSEHLTFVAYSASAGDIYDVTDSKPVLDVTVSDVVTEQKDILVAEAVDSKSATGNVSLTFSHILSRVYFNVKSDRKMTVNSVAFKGNFAPSGTYNIDEDEWTATAEAKEYNLLAADQSFTYTPEETPQVSMIVGPAETGKDYYMMLIPSENAGASIEVVYQFDGEESVQYKVSTTLDTEFEFSAGKSYNFILSLVSKTIGFEVDVTPWDEDNVNNGDPIALDGTVEVIPVNQGGENQDDENQNENA